MSENKNNPQQQGMKMNLRPDVAPGVYSNIALISHSHSDFVFDFAALLPGMPGPDVQARVIMAPEHAKSLLAALSENIMKYEREFGPIQTGQKPAAQGDTIAPFGGGHGMA